MSRRQQFIVARSARTMLIPRGPPRTLIFARSRSTLRCFRSLAPPHLPGETHVSRFRFSSDLCGGMGRLRGTRVQPQGSRLRPVVMATVGETVASYRSDSRTERCCGRRPMFPHLPRAGVVNHRPDDNPIRRFTPAPLTNRTAIALRRRRHLARHRRARRREACALMYANSCGRRSFSSIGHGLPLFSVSEGTR